MTAVIQSVPGRGSSPLGLRLSLLLVAIVLGLTVTVFGVGVVVIFTIPGAREYALAILGISVLLHSLLILAAVHLCLRRADSGWRALGFARPTWRLLHLLWQAPVLLIGLLIVQGLVFAVTGGDPGSEGDGIDSVITGVPLPLGILILLSIVLLVPLWEESLFRGVIYGGFRRRTGVLVASLLSGAAFAIAHGYPMLLPYMLTLGIGLALIREFHRNLWASVLVHATLNGAVSGAVAIALFST